ncbi:ATP-dependent RNA helicase DDX51 isoform X1 [Lepisosteus oculatus]|uniref:ATP-dependent RNA helicase DDX51 isoform X1 n=2 Tax=Lepisosteus oculatus TaxID=7918 RepID=UPI0035F52C39
MALFLINRYLGEEEECRDDDSQSRSKALLAKLQEQARARQQQKTPKGKETEHPGLPVQIDTPRGKQKKTGGEQESTDVVCKKNKKNVSKAPSSQSDSEDGQRTGARPTPELSNYCSDADADTIPQILPGKKRKRKNTMPDGPGIEGKAEASDSDGNSEKPLKSKKRKKAPEGKGKPEEERPAEDGRGKDPGSEEGRDSEETVGEMKEEISEQRETPVQSKDQNQSQSCFTVLGGFEKKAVQKVYRVLPHWLAQPNLIHRDIKSNLVPVVDVPGLCPRLLKKLESCGIQHFFPVQAEVIPAILESAPHGMLVGRGGYRPRDICVSAPTGSGKTLAFVIPVVQMLMKRVVCEVRALAVLPTKELAQQVRKVFCMYAEGTGLRVVMMAGQKSFALEQASLLENNGTGSRSLADIVVATPGRLVDHINKTPGFTLQHLRFLIIDEADRMIDSMHQAWLSHVVKAAYKGGRSSELGSLFRRAEPGPITAASLTQPQMPLQKLLFSATLTQNPEKLQQLGLYRPLLFTSVHSKSASPSLPRPASPQPQEKFNFPEGLTEYFVPCTLNSKPLIILDFILRLKFSPVLCFTNSREASHRLYLLVRLFGGVQVAEFSSRLSPNERKKTLKEFEQEKIQLLISTDATARGIDVSGVKCVINYDAPQFIRTYVHRVGRTARAGKAGLAFTFLLGVQEKRFLQMLKDAGSPGIQKQIIKPEALKALVPRYEQTLLELETAIQEERATKHI